MKVFISYCQDDSGLGLAKTAALIYETDNRNKCWYFDRDKTAGLYLNVNIRPKVTRWCTFVFLICTNGTCNSDGQQNETKWALENRISILPVRIDGAAFPEILPSGLIYDSVNSAHLIEDICRTIKKTRRYLSEHEPLPQKEIPKIDNKGTIL